MFKISETLLRCAEETIEDMIRKDLSYAEIEKMPGASVATVTEISVGLAALKAIERNGVTYFICLGRK